MKKSFKTIIGKVASAIKFAFSPAMREPALGPASTPNINATLLNLCDGDRDRALWVLRWLAYPLRHEGAKMATSLLVAGPAGTGKSLFFDHVIVPMYGPRAVLPMRVDTTFNEWMAGKLFAVADGDELASINPIRLKGMLTGGTTLIRSKGQQDRLQKNRLNFVFLSGDAKALRPETSDRRFMVIASAKRLQAATYVGAAAEIAHGGIEAFHDFLLHELDMEDFTPVTRPMNNTINLKDAA